MAHTSHFGVTVMRGDHRAVNSTLSIQEAVTFAKEKATEYGALQIEDGLSVRITEGATELVATREDMNHDLGQRRVTVGAAGPEEERRLKELGVELTEGPIVSGQLFMVQVGQPIHTIQLTVGSQVVLPSGINGKIETIVEPTPRTIVIGIRQEDGELTFLNLKLLAE